MLFPYLVFPGNCAEVLEFYQQVFQKKAIISYYKEAPKDPNCPMPEGSENCILHSEMEISGSKVCFADHMMGTVTFGNSITLTLELDTAEEVLHYYNLLKEGGQVIMEASPQFYTPMYGYVEDKFKVQWQIMAKYQN